MGQEIGLEAATLVALEYATDETEAFKTALATAAQVVIDWRDSKTRGRVESERLAATLQNLVDANGNFMAALHNERLIELRTKK